MRYWVLAGVAAALWIVAYGWYFQLHRGIMKWFAKQTKPRPKPLGGELPDPSLPASQQLWPPGPPKKK